MGGVVKMYKLKTPPKAGQGFTASEKLLIADLILYEINTAGVNLMLEKKMPPLYKLKKRCAFEGTYLTQVKNKNFDEKFLEPWEPMEKAPDDSFFSDGYKLVAPVIRIKINNFQMEVIKSVYAVRTVFKRLGLQVQKI